MVQLLSAATALGLVLSANATPVGNQNSKGTTAKNLVGFDESFVRTSSADRVIPKHTVLKGDEDFFNGTATHSPPHTVSKEQIQEVQKRYINGDDNRYQYTDTSYPFVTVGKLQWDNGVFCSASLVGPRHVLTAKHCLTDEGVAGTFSPGFDNGEPFGSGSVTDTFAGSEEWGTPCGWKSDWAVLILDNDLGNQLGFFGVKVPDSGMQDQPIFNHVGYPGDLDDGNRPYRTDGNPIDSSRPWDCDSTGPYYTDTDCAGGQSGGPHWEPADDGQYIWGVLSVTFDGGDGSAWAGWGSGQEMLDAVLQYKDQFP